jgi:hypothetical protein
VGLGVFAAGLIAPASAQAASSCSGASGYWTCYSTTGTKSYATTVIRSWSLINSTSKTINAKCTVTTSASYSSTSSQSVSASVKAGLFGVAEGTVTGTQTFTDTLTVSEATALEFSFTMGPGESRVCQLTHGYYKVGTKYEQWNNYKVVTSLTGTTTVPYQWGLRLA